MRLCLVASKPTDSVIFGFLPAAARLGLDVILLTDKPEEHKRALPRARLSRGRGWSEPRGRSGTPVLFETRGRSGSWSATYGTLAG